MIILSEKISIPTHCQWQWITKMAFDNPKIIKSDPHLSCLGSPLVIVIVVAETKRDHLIFRGQVWQVFSPSSDGHFFFRQLSIIYLKPFNNQELQHKTTKPNVWILGSRWICMCEYSVHAESACMNTQFIHAESACVNTRFMWEYVVHNWINCVTMFNLHVEIQPGKCGGKCFGFYGQCVFLRRKESHGTLCGLPKMDCL